MAPPVAVIVIVSVATGTAVAYVVKENWEPRIKPQLIKARNTAKTWWEKRHAAIPTQVRSSPLFRRRATAAEHPITNAEPSALERIISHTIYHPDDREGALRQRLNRDRSGVPGDGVEMAELDKSVPVLSQTPIVPSNAQTTRYSFSASEDSSIGPFSEQSALSGLATPPLSEMSQHTLHSPARGLQLSFPPPSEHPPLALGPPHLDPSSNVAARDHSPWATASALSWTDGGDIHSFTMSSAHEDEDGTFSIGSYDDISSNAHESERMMHEVDERDEPESPPHHSDQGSPDGSRQGLGSGVSSSDWESVGSPVMSSPSAGGRRPLVMPA